jgi:hypothetical protein
MTKTPSAFIANDIPGGVTITGLPTDQPLGFNLNNIAPAAGGEQGETSAVDLNEIDTAAGSEQAACWNQVYGHLSGSSAPVTYSLDETPSALLGSAGCQ